MQIGGIVVIDDHYPIVGRCRTSLLDIAEYRTGFKLGGCRHKAFILLGAIGGAVVCGVVEIWLSNLIEGQTGRSIFDYNLLCFIPFYIAMLASMIAGAWIGSVLAIGRGQPLSIESRKRLSNHTSRGKSQVTRVYVETAQAFEKEYAIAKTIRTRYVPQLEKLADELENRYPDYTFRASDFGHRIESSRGSHDHLSVILECEFPNRSTGQPEHVSLDISLFCLESNPKLSAFVVWDHPSGYYEASLSRIEPTGEDWPKTYPRTIPVTPSALSQLEQCFPHLCSAFKEAVQRGHPPEAHTSL